MVTYYHKKNAIKEQYAMPNLPAKTNNKQGGRFQSGQSGNPNGRPHGSRNKATLALEAILDSEDKTSHAKPLKTP